MEDVGQDRKSNRGPGKYTVRNDTERDQVAEGPVALDERGSDLDDLSVRGSHDVKTWTNTHVGKARVKFTRISELRYSR